MTAFAKKLFFFLRSALQLLFLRAVQLELCCIIKHRMHLIMNYLIKKTSAFDEVPKTAPIDCTFTERTAVCRHLANLDVRISRIRLSLHGALPQGFPNGSVSFD